MDDELTRLKYAMWDQISAAGQRQQLPDPEVIQLIGFVAALARGLHEDRCYIARHSARLRELGVDGIDRLLALAPRDR